MTMEPMEDDTIEMRPSTSHTEVKYNQFKVCGVLFECPVMYRPIKPIGKGAYGTVCSATHVESKEKLAIKKMTAIFDNPLDAKRTLREVKILRHLQGHENIVHLHNVLPPPLVRNFEDVYMVYELMDTDLHQIIRSSQPLSDEHIQYFIYQTLRGLKYIHSANILHRDLKPSNLLLNANCDLKICDFGLARTGNEQEYMTEYVVTRWYRAPELLLSCAEYNEAIDLWSVGCIFAELLGRKPLFPGKDYAHQLTLITRVCGTPGEDDLRFVSSEKAKRYMLNMPQCPRAAFDAYFPGITNRALDLLERMLVFNPGRRISVDDALAHPYFGSLHDLHDEPICPAKLHFSIDGEHLAPPVVRELLFQEMVSFNPVLKGEIVC